MSPGRSPALSAWAFGTGIGRSPGGTADDHAAEEGDAGDDADKERAMTASRTRTAVLSMGLPHERIRCRRLAGMWALFA